jgi:eukaryotic-like serine/threonine-protein kinase
VSATRFAQAFRINPAADSRTDLFAAVCAKGADLLVADSAALGNRLPAWWREKVDGGTFVLLPLQLNGAPIGLLYADKAVAGSLQLGDAELALLRALRDQTVAAISRGS